MKDLEKLKEQALTVEQLNEIYGISGEEIIQGCEFYIRGFGDGINDNGDSIINCLLGIKEKLVKKLNHYNDMYKIAETIGEKLLTSGDMRSIGYGIELIDNQIFNIKDENING